MAVTLTMSTAVVVVDIEPPSRHRRHVMKKGLTMTVGAGVGAGLMYLYDPQMGRRRRAVARDKFIHVGRGIVDAVDVTSHDLTNRAVGLLAEMRSIFVSEEVADEVLAERVRAQLGGLVSHPRAIEVRAEQGRVNVSGAVLRDEVDPLLKGVTAVRGVYDVASLFGADPKSRMDEDLARLKTFIETGKVPSDAAARST
jgi:hypothetical protein